MLLLTSQFTSISFLVEQKPHPMLAKNVAFCFILLLSVAFVSGYENKPNAKLPKSELHTRLALGQPIARDPFHGQLRGGALSLRRRDLRQTVDGDCYWNSKSDACHVNFPVLFDLLDDVDNPVSNFVHKELTCQLATDEDTCKDLECLWTDDAECSSTIEDYRSVHDAKCMKRASHLTDLAAGTRECQLLSTKGTCTNNPSCFWIQDACHFDKWYYYHGITTKNGYPESMDELVDLRTKELALSVHRAMNDGEIISHADIMEWDPPAFDCPKGHEKVVCNFVEAYTPFFLQTLSCGLHTPTECTTDPSCTFHFESGCTAAVRVFLQLDQEAEFVFAEGIKNADARNFETKVAECIYMHAEDDCVDRKGCRWLESLNVCVVSRKWEQLEARRLVGNTSEPVCDFFTVDLSSGCIDIDDEDKCEADPSCMYIKASESCATSVTGEAFHVLSSSKKTAKDLKKAIKKCGLAKTEKSCKAIGI